MSNGSRVASNYYGDTVYFFYFVEHDDNRLLPHNLEVQDEWMTLLN